MIHVSSSAQVQLQGWLLLRLYSFLKKYRKIFAVRLPVRPTPAFPSPDNLSEQKRVGRRFSSPPWNPSEQAQRTLGGGETGTGWPGWTSTHQWHQLAVLSIGWAPFFHPAPDPELINIVPQSTFWSHLPTNNKPPTFIPTFYLLAKSLYFLFLD